MVGGGGGGCNQFSFLRARGERDEGENDQTRWIPEQFGGKRRTWVEVPLVVLCRRRQRQRHGDHGDGEEEPRGWNSHDSSNTPGYLSGEARAATGIPGEKETKKGCLSDDGGSCW